MPALEGLSGGYSASVDESGTMTLGLPAGLTRDQVVAWNARLRAESGLIIDRAG